MKTLMGKEDVREVLW